MNNKFELLENDRIPNGEHPFYRIRALRDIKCCSNSKSIFVPKGSLGGYVQTEKSLNSNDESWIFCGTTVDSESFITGNSIVIDKVVEEHEKTTVSIGIEIIDSTITDYSTIVRDSNKCLSIDDSKIAESTIISSDIECASITNSFVSRTDILFPPIRRYVTLPDDSFILSKSDFIDFGNLIMTHNTIKNEVLISCPLFIGKLSDFLNNYPKNLLMFLGYDNLLNESSYENKTDILLEAKKQIEKKFKEGVISA